MPELLVEVDAGTRQTLKALVEPVRTGECILFLGSGVNAPPPPGSGFTYPAEERPPMAGELAEMLAERFAFSEFLDEPATDLKRVSLHAETSPGGGRRALITALEHFLVKGKKPSPALSLLAQLPFQILVTTNYDSLLEDALRAAGKTPDPFYYDPDGTEPTRDVDDDPTADRPMVLKIHGDLARRESVVITDEDYIRFVQRMSDKASHHPVPETIRYRMKRWPTLFFGYSLRDYNFRLLFKSLRWKIDTSKFPPAYSIDSNPDALILRVWQDERRFVTFVAQDLWRIVPWLKRQIDRRGGGAEKDPRAEE